MQPPFLHSYLLWRSGAEPKSEVLTTRRVTASVSLLPAFMVGLFVFGWYANLVVVIAVISAFITDYISHKLNGRFIFNNTQGSTDATWLLTGLLIGLFLPPDVPLWVPAIASIAAILIGKYWLSVEDMPLLQPAVVGLLLLQLLMPWLMHPSVDGTPKWPVLARSIEPPEATESLVGHTVKQFLGGNINHAIERSAYQKELFNGRQPLYDPERKIIAEAYYGPRPLDLVRQHPKTDVAQLDGVNYGTLDVLFGNTPGSIGATSGLALLWGILLLIFTGTISWLVPLTGMTVLGLGIYWLDGPQNIGLHLFSGYTLLGFCYLAAESTTIARSSRGKLLAGLLLGLSEIFMRKVVGLSEGVVFSALIVQGFAIVLDLYVAPPKEERTMMDTSMNLPSLRKF